MAELAKLDLLRERLGVTYQEALEALTRAEGDVVQALILLETEEKECPFRKLWLFGQDLIKKGNITKIRLKKQGKVIGEIPATLGALGLGGMFWSPLLATLGVAGSVVALVQDYTLEIVRPDGQVEEHDLQFLKEKEED